jgi:pimeloyl-ACP methyl ester carboxylesterase
MATFVLVHGAFIGGWAWQDVARTLRALGHEVYTPTLTGLGERHHLGRPETTLDIHIEDVLNLCYFEDLRAVRLVGWSYGGMVVAGVADRIPERIVHVIHVDGDAPIDGQSAYDITPGWQTFCEERARGDGWRVVPSHTDALDEQFRDSIPDDQRRRWFVERFTPQPIQTFAQPIHLVHTAPPGVRQTFVRCIQGDMFEEAYSLITTRIRSLPDWEYREIAGDHGAPYGAPDLVAQELHAIVTSRDSTP